MPCNKSDGNIPLPRATASAPMAAAVPAAAAPSSFAASSWCPAWYLGILVRGGTNDTRSSGSGIGCGSNSTSGHDTRGSGRCDTGIDSRRCGRVYFLDVRGGTLRGFRGVRQRGSKQANNKRLLIVLADIVTFIDVAQVAT